jgi:3-oxoacyl-[acyl-carrier-protein] synthase III
MASFSFKNASVSGIAVAIPERIVQLSTYESTFGKSNVEKFIREAGIISKHIADEEQTASDLGFIASKKLIDNKGINNEDIRVLIFVSRTPDYRNPPSAAILHYRLNLSKDCLAYDINMGSAGFIYGLEVCCSLVEKMGIKYGLLIVGDTSSKLCSGSNPASMLFGDAVSAILIEKKTEYTPIFINTYAYGYQYDRYILRDGGFRLLPAKMETDPKKNDLVIMEDDYHSFVLSELPPRLESFLNTHNISINSFDIIALHQERNDLTIALKNKLSLKDELTPVRIRTYGNTSGASIPLLLADIYGNNEETEIKVLSIGYGEGFSLGFSVFKINSSDIMPVIETVEVFSEGSVDREI